MLAQMSIARLHAAFSLRDETTCDSATTQPLAGAYSGMDGASNHGVVGGHGGEAVREGEPLELLLLQLEVERIGVVAGETLVRLPGERPDGIPRFYIAELASGITRYYRDDVPAATRAELAALPVERARDDHAAVQRILAQDAPCTNIWAGVSYYFPDGVVGPADYPDVVALDWSRRAEIERFDAEMTSFGWPVYVVRRDGQIVATCVSTRETERAGEAWVQTTPAHRGQGYARQVTAAWGDALLRQGKVAFYSHALDNVASGGVARTLRLAPYLRDIGYS